MGFLPRAARFGQRLLVVFAGAAVVFVAGTGPAFAHAVLVSSTPQDGSNVSTAPTQVSITFDESVGLNPGYLRVINSAGQRVDSGAAFHPDGRGDVVAVALRRNLPTAAYLASYRVVSADSHPVGGVVRFAVGGASLDDVANISTGSRTDPTVSVTLDMARSASFIGLAAAGGWWLVVLMLARRDAESERERFEWPRGTRALIAAGVATAFVGALLELLLQGPYAAAAGPGAVGRIGLLADTVSSSFGIWHLVQLSVLGVLGVLIASRWHRYSGRHPAAVVVGIGAVWLLGLISVAATGHAAVRAPVWLGELSIIAHLVAITAWIGGLATLAVASLAGDADDLDRALPVFSTVALTSVGLIAASGAYQAWREVGAWRAFVDTEYGVLVLVKIVLFAGLIGLGALARSRLRAGGVLGRHRRVRTGVLVELVVAVAVLGVSGVLVAQPPGRESTAAASAVVPAGSQSVQLDATRRLTVTVEPAKAGPILVTVSVTGGPAVQKVTVTAAQPAQSIGPIPIDMYGLGGQTFASLVVTLPASGLWQFAVSVQTSEFDVVTATVPIALA